MGDRSDSGLVEVDVEAWLVVVMMDGPATSAAVLDFGGKTWTTVAQNLTTWMIRECKTSRGIVIRTCRPVYLQILL
jgi:hypothetical protein